MLNIETSSAQRQLRNTSVLARSSATQSRITAFLSLCVWTQCVIAQFATHSHTSHSSGSLCVSEHVMFCYSRGLRAHFFAVTREHQTICFAISENPNKQTHTQKHARAHMNTRSHSVTQNPEKTNTQTQTHIHDDDDDDGSKCVCVSNMYCVHSSE